MFVVRLTPKDGKPDFKAFRGLAAARSRYEAAWGPNYGMDALESAVLFHVPNEDDVRRAVEAVTAGRAGDRGPRQLARAEGVHAR